MWPYICKPIMVIFELLGEASNLDAALTRRLYVCICIYIILYILHICSIYILTPQWHKSPAGHDVTL